MRFRTIDIEPLESRRALSASTASPRILCVDRLRINEDATAPLRIRVVDAPNALLTVSVRASGGTLVLESAAAGAQQTLVTTAGTPAQINKALQSLSYRPDKDSTRAETLTITTTNGGKASARSIRVAVTAVNDPPVVAAQEPRWSTQGHVIWDGPAFSDPDSTRISVSLRADRGTVRIVDPAATNAKGTARISGDVAAINRLFSTPGRVLLAGSRDADARITIRVSDGRLTTDNTVTAFVRQTVQQHATDAVESRLAGRDPSVAKPIFSVADHVQARYERNPHSWAADLDLTPISPWNDHAGNFMAGTLVSPRHVIYATHFAMPAGTTLRFVARDNTVHERTLVGTKSMPYRGTSTSPDITVGVLDSDVPESIGFARILPADWSRYLPSGRIDTPCLALDQEEKALVTDLFLLNDDVTFVMPDKASRRAFFEPLVWGDSGNPGFMIVGDQLVLLTVWTTGWGGHGSSIAYHKAQIDRMMQDLGGGYHLTEIDLAAFRRIG